MLRRQALSDHTLDIVDLSRSFSRLNQNLRQLTPLNTLPAHVPVPVVPGFGLSRLLSRRAVQVSFDSVMD